MEDWFSIEKASLMLSPPLCCWDKRMNFNQNKVIEKEHYVLFYSCLVRARGRVLATRYDPMVQ